jgi:uncharacterized SAM-binding protein YcdF (DUF218 family)
LGRALKTNPLKPKTRKRIYLLNAVLLIVPLAYLGYPMALRAMAQLLIVSDAPLPSDAIVVLAGGDPGRALTAAELFKARVAPIVVVSRETPPPIYEKAKRDGVVIVQGYENYLRVLEGYGVPPARLIRLEQPVSDTYDELLRVRDFAYSRGWKRIVIVTSNFHTRRARLVARFLLEPQLAVAVIASRYDAFRPEAWWISREDTRTFTIEMQKLIAYSLYIWPRRLWKTHASTKPPGSSSAPSDFFSTPSF